MSQSYSISNHQYTLTLTLTETSIDSNANTSVVAYSLILYSQGNYFSEFGLGASISFDGSVIANKDRYSTPQVTLYANSSITLLSGTATVAHNSDGSKTLAVAFSIDMELQNYTPGPLSVTGQAYALTTILRGFFYVFNGSSWIARALYVYNGSGWIRRFPYTYNGSGWILHS